MMKFWKKTGLTCCALLFAFFAFGQNDFFYNHYMFNPSYYNPAWVGTEGKAFFAGHHRSQWVGFATSFDGTGGAPSSQLLSVVVPWEGTLTGTGVAISNDRVANLNNLQIRFSLSATKTFRFGDLSFGLMPSIFSQSLDFSQLRPVEPEPNLPQGKETQIQPDLSAGVYFQSNGDFYAGFSVVNILEPSFDFGAMTSRGDPFSNTVFRNYLIHAGTDIRIRRELVITPSTLIRTDFSSYTFDLSGIVTYREKIWGGLNFRRSESVALMMGYSFLEDNRLKFGYSFDYVVNDREAKQPTSHEFYLRYDLPGVIFGGKKMVTTPRFPIGAR